MKTPGTPDAFHDPESSGYEPNRKDPMTIKGPSSSKPLDFIESFLRDLRYGTRTLLRSPMFTLVVTLTLALGIGANTAIFTLVNAVMVRSLPVESPEGLYVFGADGRMGQRVSDRPEERDTNLFSYPLYQDFRTQGELFSDLAAISSYTIYVFATGEAPVPGEPMERFHARLVTGNFFDLLGVPADQGRTLTPTDDRAPGAHPVAVISHGLWTRKFGEDPEVVNQTLDLSGTRYSIVGVAPAGFHGVTVGHATDVWVPMAMQSQITREPFNLDTRETMWLCIFGRLEPGASVEAAEAMTNEIFRRVVTEVVGSELTADSEQTIAALATELVPFSRGFSPLRMRYSRPLVFLMSVVGLVLLIACANVGNLQLARAASREQEVALRLALGSSRNRLLRHFLTESLILALLGGALGLLVARWLITLLLSLISTRAVPIDVGLNLRVLGFTLAVSLLSVLLFGLVPALRSSGTELNTALKREGGSSEDLKRGWGLREVLLVSQVAISLPLLVAAGLFVASLQNLKSEETGVSHEELLAAYIDPQGGGYETEQLSGLYRDLLERVEALPEVESASIAYLGPFGSGRYVNAISIDGFQPQSAAEALIENDLVTPGYFETIGARLLAGRALAGSDAEGAPQVAVVNEAFASRYFGGRSPVGERFGIDGDDTSQDIEIVGMVANFKQHDLRGEAPPMAYFPVAQRMSPLFTLLTRSHRDPATIIPQVSHAIAEVAPGLPLIVARPISDVIERTLLQETMIAKLTTLFGLLALILASLGLYGVVAYGVSRRTREIGVRIALGALRAQVTWMALKSALILVVIGVAIGLAVALASGRLISGLLFGLDPANLETLLQASLVLIGVALVAGFWPAHRASRLDPVRALRQE
jgi:predicted permease